MKSCMLHVRSLGCGAVVNFRVLSKFNLNPEMLEDRLAAMVEDKHFEVTRLIGDQGAVFFEFRLPYSKLFDSRKEGLLSALAQVEREVQAAIEQKRLLDMVVQS